VLVALLAAAKSAALLATEGDGEVVVAGRWTGVEVVSSIENILFSIVSVF
jgi:hypothetical protein